MNAREITAALRGNWRNGKGYCRCPAHNDTTPSLEVTEKGGKTLVICRAGCTQDAVISALRAMGAWATAEDHPKDEVPWQPPAKPQVVATFEYRAEDGSSLRKLRIEPGTNGRSKMFRWQHQEQDQWVDGEGPSKHLLYGHDDIDAAGHDDIIAIVESERSRDILAKTGLLAVATGGSNGWRTSDAKMFNGHRVVVLPDNDGPGMKMAEAVRADLPNAIVVKLPDLPPGEGPDHWPLIHDKAALETIINANTINSRNWIEASEVAPKNIDWLWKPRLIAGRINLIVGMGDVGKDTWCCRLVASLTNNIAWPDDQQPPRPMRVGMWCPEDEAADTIVPRLDAASADRKLIKIWDKASPPSPSDVREVDVFFVSPLISLMDGGKSMNSEQDAREFLQLWQHGGQRTVIGTGHLSKKTDLSAVQRILGASGIVNFCRSTWLIQRDTDDKNVRLFQRLKANLTPDDTSGLKFEIEHVGPWDQSIRANVTGTTEANADEIMQANVNGLGKQSAPRWLVAYLTEKGGVAQASVIFEAGAKAGHKKDALEQAMNRNDKITASRKGFGKDGESWWTLEGS